ncbi:TPA: helix-turn-helix domain-containing protein [Pseudomonas putida]|uniref:helix-turn-helix domain-containing protein n=1 Tax=Pseudomonas putida TaxID=303 RepID=UPI0023647B7E|nr:helix-turn-helix domain-containing protein [Pseudomonas putida]MDD2012832.1 helix-turn-helix domain-containing protein [Pseudomonas putida]HDS1780280.1 helix-turn-helix domain-containing protein [Pseudomonas putida]
MSALILPNDRQLEIFGAADEAKLYHPGDRHGFFSLLFGSHKKTQRSYPLTEMAQVLQLVDYTRDTWISQAEFTVPNRRVVNLARVGLLFIDLDTYNSDIMRGRTVHEQISTVHYWCADRNIPYPSLVVFSGRGLQLKWFLDNALPRAALPRWNACQKALVEALEPLGADRQARDASRVLRLVESLHSKSGERVEVVDVQGSADEPVRYDFEQLAEILLPLTRFELQKLREHRAAKKADRQLRLQLVRDNPKAEIFRGYNGRSLAWARLEDLRTLGQLRGGWISPQGASMRTTSLHWQLNFLCLSGAVNPATFHFEAKELAKQLDPAWEFSISELGTLRQKAQAYASGQKIEFGGREWPPLYTPKNQTLIDIFGITVDEQRQLRTIITKDLARERNTERERVKRRAAGVVERSQYDQERQQKSLDRAAQIKALKAEGKSASAIAKELGVTTRTVFNALKS